MGKVFDSSVFNVALFENLFWTSSNELVINSVLF
jgi:hypothetical protein